MKKILLILILGMFLINFISAFEFDNVKSYNETTRTAIIKDSILGIPTTTVAEIKLDTPLNVNVMQGKNRLVAKFTLINYEKDYTNALKQLELYKAETMKQINRNFKYKVAVYDWVNVPEYKEMCSTDKTGFETCYNEKVAEHLERKIIRWDEMDLNKMPLGEITIGIFADVQAGDYVEWIPTFFGVKINEWATWNETFENSLIAWYDLDELSGSVLDYTGWNNGTNNGATTGVAGVINEAYDFEKDESDYVALDTGSGNISAITSTDFSVSFWIKREQLSYNQAGYIGGLSNNAFGIASDSGNRIGLSKIGVAQSFTSGTVADTNWHHIVVVVNSSGNTAEIFIDGTSNGGFAWIHEYTAGIQYNLAKVQSGDFYDGYMDLIGIWKRKITASEVSDLYNGGDGLNPSVQLTTINLENPANNAQFNTIPQTIKFNCTGEDETAILNVSLWINDELNFTQLNTTANSNVTLEHNVTFYSEGTYNWTCKAWDGETEAEATRNFKIDATSPTVNITTPLNNTNYLSFASSLLIPLNFTSSDINLQACWFYNGTGNTSLVCGTNTTQTFFNGYSTIIFYANDTAGNIGQTSSRIFINLINFSFGFNPSEIENENISISLNITGANITEVTANLTYNNTIQPMNLLSNNGTLVQFSTFIITPEIDSDTIINLSANFTINGVKANTSIKQQTIYKIPDLIIQSTPCNDTALVFNLSDEQNFTSLNGNLEYNFQYGTTSNNTFSKNYGQISSTNILYVCINSTILPEWSLGHGEIFYRTADHVDRRYYLFEGTTISNNSINNISLYDLLISEQTSFKLEVEDTSLNPYVEKFTALLRWYPQLNEYKIVEMGQTDEKGNTVLHVQDEDIDYRVAVYERNGTLVKMEDPTRFVCLINPCTYTLRISPSDTDFTSLFDIDYTFTYNYTTSMWSFIYSDSSQKTSLMNLTIYKVTGTSVYEICSDTSTSYVGALSCNTSAYSGNLKGVVERSASPSVPIVQKVISTTTTAFNSSFGIFLSLLIGIPIVFIFSIMSPVGAIIGGVISLIPALYFGAINWAIIGGIAILGGIVMHFLKRIG